MTGEESGQDTDTQGEIARLQRELDEARKLAEERLTRLQYLQADFDNYRKSLEREREQVIQLAGESLVRDLLPVLDDLERALPSLSQEKNREGFDSSPGNFIRYWRAMVYAASRATGSGLTRTSTRPSQRVRATRRTGLSSRSTREGTCSNPRLLDLQR